MSELTERASIAMVGITEEEWTWDLGFADDARKLIPELVAEVERLQAESAHWKSLWQGTVEYSTKVIQERDEALREVERLTRELERAEAVNISQTRRADGWRNRALQAEGAIDE